MEKEFLLGKTKYSIRDDEQGFQLRGHCYYKYFKIYKDNKFWSAVEAGITDPVISNWKHNDEQIDIEKFLSEISPYIIKLGVYNNEIREGDEIKKYLLCFGPKNSNMKRAFSSASETLEHYRKQAEEIDSPRIGFK